MRGPPRLEIVKWVLGAWETLDRELIIRSLRSCVLIVAPDGSEDDQIHCLKEGQPCMQGKIAWHPSRKPKQLLARLTHLLTFTLSDVEKAAPESSLIY